MTIVYRVQDNEGRGPWRPGFSTMWLDEDIGDRAALPSTIEDFGKETIERLTSTGEHYGTACRSIDALRAWFTPTEIKRLDGFGFRLVEFRDARILIESEHQALIARSRPLSFGATVRRWP